MTRRSPGHSAGHGLARLPRPPGQARRRAVGASPLGRNPSSWYAEPTTISRGQPSCPCDGHWAGVNSGF